MQAPIVSETDVLIVGAGPTGLVLALWLKRLGVRIKIIDKAAQAGTTSRALAVQARTLELYGQIGLAEGIVARGRKASAANFWVRGKNLARAAFADMGAGISPFPYVLIFPQDEHERLLTDCLAEDGLQVDRETELSGFEEIGGSVVARIKRPDGFEETCTAAFLIGCDGAHSIVRETLKIDFLGGTYTQLFYVADVQGTSEAINGEVHVALDKTDFLAVFPLKQDGHARLVGTVRQQAQEPQESLSWNDVRKDAIKRLRIGVKHVNWFSTYRVHHRVAEHFRKGCSFLLGDAAHVHSPVGGQGMNTGIGDAVNLAWKLAAVLKGNAHVSLLDSYELERIEFARRLVATTDRAFTGVTSNSWLARLLRLDIVPLLIPRLFAFNAVKRFLFRTVSQIEINYRTSPLSKGCAGKIHGGDRLPWAKVLTGGEKDNYVSLRSLDWQVHVYGEAAPEIQKECARRKLPLHSFPWHADLQQTGLRRNVLYLVRPDGYVALADSESSPLKLASYLDACKLAR